MKYFLANKGKLRMTGFGKILEVAVARLLFSIPKQEIDNNTDISRADQIPVLSTLKHLFV